MNQLDDMKRILKNPNNIIVSKQYWKKLQDDYLQLEKENLQLEKENEIYEQMIEDKNKKLTTLKNEVLRLKILLTEYQK